MWDYSRPKIERLNAKYAWADQNHQKSTDLNPLRNPINRIAKTISCGVEPEKAIEQHIYEYRDNVIRNVFKNDEMQFKIFMLNIFNGITQSIFYGGTEIIIQGVDIKNR